MILIFATKMLQMTHDSRDVYWENFCIMSLWFNIEILYILMYWLNINEKNW